MGATSLGARSGGTPRKTRRPRLSPTDAPLRDIAYQRLCEAILAQTLEVAAPLSISTLCSQLGVSRTPLREALLRLERQGVVSMRASQCTVILPPSQDSAVATASLARYLVAEGLCMALPTFSVTEHRKLIKHVGTWRRAAEAGDSTASMHAFFELFAAVARSQTGTTFFAVMSETAFVLQRDLRLMEFAAGESSVMSARFDQLEHALTSRDAIATGDAIDSLLRTSISCHALAASTA